MAILAGLASGTDSQDAVLCIMQACPALEIRSEQACDLAPDVRSRPAIFNQELECIGEDRSQSAPGVPPLIDDLLQNASVRMLRDKGGSEHLDALPCDLRENRRLIQEPPAPKHQDVGKFTHVNAQLMLIFPA